MNRRKAIYGILGLGAIAAAGSTCYNLLRCYTEPDLAYIALNKLLIADIADTIIPRTTTAGAKDLNVEEFVILMIRDCTDKKNQNAIVFGLKDIKEFALANYKKEFSNCSLSERISILTHFEDKEVINSFARKVKAKLVGGNFMALLKQYTAIGYCTSEQGATASLSYLPVPGAFEGCIPLEKEQKSWATK